MVALVGPQRLQIDIISSAKVCCRTALCSSLHKLVVLGMCTQCMQQHSAACQQHSGDSWDKAGLHTWSWFRELLVSAKASLALGSGGGPATGAGAGAIAPCTLTGSDRLLRMDQQEHV